MFGKHVQLSLFLHVVLIVLFFIISQYNKPIPKIQVTLVPNIPNLNKNNKPKAQLRQQQPVVKPQNIIIKELTNNAATVTPPMLPVVTPKKTTKPLKEPPKNNNAPYKQSTIEHKAIDLNPPSNPVLNVPQMAKAPVPLIKKDAIPMLKNPAIAELVELENVPPKDLMDLDLSDTDKQLLARSLSNCVATLPKIREHDEILFLRFKVNEDAIVENIDIIKNNQIVPSEQLNNLEQRVVAIFKNTNCSKLLLPKNDYKIWHEFSVKLKLEGFFNE